MIEMKPCPFCGAKPEINRCVDMPDGVSLGAQVVCFNPLCPAHVGATGHTEAEAIEAWNTRRQNISDVLIEALEECREAADDILGPLCAEVGAYLNEAPNDNAVDVLHDYSVTIPFAAFKRLYDATGDGLETVLADARGLATLRQAKGGEG